MKMFSQLLLCLAEVFLDWKMFHTQIAEKIRKKHFMFNNLFRKLCHLSDNVEAKQATKNSVAHQLCMTSK
jgi:hypothetical protein